MRHGKRHLPYAVSTVLGLVAPAAAALVLTTSVPTLAAPVAPAAPAETEVVDEDPRPLLGWTMPVPAPVVTVAPKPVAVAPKAVLKAAPKRVARTAAARPAVRRTAPKPTTTRASAPKASAPRPSSTSQTSQPWGVNDYPYKNQSDFYAIDRWGFTQRQCVSFAAWRLAQHGRAISNKNNQWGSALNWDDAARRLGRAVSRTARVGSIAHWNAGESSPYYGKGSAKANGSFRAGGYGHVGWVKQVYADGSALVEQYNMGGSRSYNVMRVKAPRYLRV